MSCHNCCLLLLWFGDLACHSPHPYSEPAWREPQQRSSEINQFAGGSHSWGIQEGRRRGIYLPQEGMQWQGIGDWPWPRCYWSWFLFCWQSHAILWGTTRFNLCWGLESLEHSESIQSMIVLSRLDDEEHWSVGKKPPKGHVAWHYSESGSWRLSWLDWEGWIHLLQTRLPKGD